jgi:hypothetical protein
MPIKERTLRRKLARISMEEIILEEIIELASRLKRMPCREELLDTLFSTNRHDPEAKYLERALNRTLKKYLR